MTRSIKYISIAILAASVFSIGCGRTSITDSVKAEPLPSSSADPKIADALELIRTMPDSPMPLTQLAGLYIQKARRTGDFSLNSKAQTAVDQALALDAKDIPARKLQASLDLTFHRFSEALVAGNALREEFPNDAFVYGVITDANDELGNYKEAIISAQQMVDLKPNSSSYSRVGHIRSLHGDHKGAIDMLTISARTADPKDAEAQAWCLDRLAQEMFKFGEIEAADKVYDEALAILPGFYLAEVGKARTLAARGETQAAAELLSRSTQRVPSLEGFILLGDIYTKLGDTTNAKANYDLAETIDTKLGLANDHKRLAQMWLDQDEKPVEALAITTAEYALRKDILTADTHAWALYRNGKFAEAKRVMAEALRIKTSEPRYLYHAGLIEIALGNKAAGRGYLETALKQNAEFDVLQADAARTALGDSK